MANKIKEIFSNDMFSIESNIRFTDKEAYNRFHTLLSRVYNEGNTFEADGIASMSLAIRQYGNKYPLEEHSNITNFVIGPAIEAIPITLLVDGQEKEIKLFRSETKDAVTVKSGPDAIIFFQLIFSKNENKHTVKYNVQIEKAKTIEEIVESYLVTKALFEKLFITDKPISGKKDALTIHEVIQYFYHQASFYNRLLAVLHEFDLSISTSILKGLTTEEQRCIDELYLLICDHKIVRLNGNFTYDESTSITFNDKTADLNVGNNLDLTYLETCEYSFLGQSVIIFTANFFTNLIIKDITTESDGSTKVLYGDIDSKPMYVSFSAYKTEEEASEECKTIIEHVEDYKNAEYSNVYIRKYYSK